MLNTDQLNAQVTWAILKGETALKDAVTAWEKVLAAETALGHAEAGLERDIAWRGSGRAALVVHVLRALLGTDRSGGEPT